MTSFLNKLEKKLSFLTIPNLMLLIVITMFTVFLVNFLTPQIGILTWMNLEWHAVSTGQWWRIITFLFVPMSMSPIFIIFTLYFYYLIGSSLEAYWGAFRFNLYYLIGVIGMIITAILTGFSGNIYLNFSLFFAFALLNPNFQILLFFIIPLKIKYLAYFNAAFFAYELIFGTYSTKIQILFSVINLFLFFGKDFYHMGKRKWRTRHHSTHWR